MPNVFDKVISTTTSRGLSSFRTLIDERNADLNRSAKLGVARGGARLSVSTPAIDHKPTPLNKPDSDWKVIIRQAPDRNNSKERLVVAYLPDTISTDLSSQWDPTFSDGIFGNGKIASIARIMGFNPIVQSMTAHFWQGSAPMDLSLPLSFTSYEDSLETIDKLLTLKAMALPTKEENTGFLRAPGPLLDWDSSKILPYVKDVGEAGLEIGKLGLSALGNLLPGKDTEVASGTGQGLMDNLSQRIQQAVSAIERNQVLKVSGKISVKLGRFMLFDDVIIRSIAETVKTTLEPGGRPITTEIVVNFTTRVTPVFEDVVKMHLSSLNERGAKEAARAAR